MGFATHTVHFVCVNVYLTFKMCFKTLTGCPAYDISHTHQSPGAWLNLISIHASTWRSKNMPEDILKIAKSGRKGLIGCDHIVPLVWSNINKLQTSVYLIPS